MQVSSTAKLLLDVYLDCRVLANEHLTMKALVTTKIRWNRDHQDNFHTALEELMDKRYLAKSATGMVLTDKGYDFLHRGRSDGSMSEKGAGGP